jgi:hypothetical protein
MAGLTLRSGISSRFAMGTRVRARSEFEVARCSRGAGDESGAGFEPAR